MDATQTKGDQAVEHILEQIRIDGRKAYLLGWGSRSFEILTEAYAERHGLDLEAYRKEFWSRCRPQRVVIHEADD